MTTTEIRNAKVGADFGRKETYSVLHVKLKMSEGYQKEWDQ